MAYKECNQEMVYMDEAVGDDSYSGQQESGQSNKGYDVAVGDKSLSGQQESGQSNKGYDVAVGDKSLSGQQESGQSNKGYDVAVGDKSLSGQQESGQSNKGYDVAVGDKSLSGQQESGQSNKGYDVAVGDKSLSGSFRPPPYILESEKDIGFGGQGKVFKVRERKMINSEFDETEVETQGCESHLLPALKQEKGEGRRVKEVPPLDKVMNNNVDLKSSMGFKLKTREDRSSIQQETDEGGQREDTFISVGEQRKEIQNNQDSFALKRIEVLESGENYKELRYHLHWKIKDSNSPLYGSLPSSSVKKNYEESLKKEASNLVDNALIEVKMLETLKGHRNIVNVYDHYFQSDDQSHSGSSKHGPVLYLCIVMELCDSTLRDFRTNNEMTLEVIKDFACQLLCGIHFIHFKKLIHRDINEDNIMVKFIDGICRLKYIDVGSSRAFSECETSKAIEVQFDLHGIFELVLQLYRPDEDRSSALKDLKEEKGQPAKKLVSVLDQLQQYPSEATTLECLEILRDQTGAGALDDEDGAQSQKSGTGYDEIILHKVADLEVLDTEIGSPPDSPVDGKKVFE
ncbi:uncharacterized protein LOC101864023 [Aplysia californica]|uniref:Uncharacterized protein LOC101864023 n=1 Tax=Aplysia californica TaxID=6500 RepID=A0ABM1AAK6_APLCA|nr:uncharacterized protein LOC101864023 [Aplysia californica]